MKKLAIFALAIVFLLPLAGATPSINVVTTTTILGDFVKAVGGDKVIVTTLVQPGVCPAHFDIKPSDIFAVSNASLILYHGIEPWMDNLIQASGSNARIEKLPGPWNTPSKAIEKIRKIEGILAEVSPENARYFKENADRLCEEINKTAESIKKEASEIKASEINVVCMQWQASFVKWLGFNVVATYPPPEKLSTKDVNEIISKAKEGKAILVVDNLQSGTEFGSSLATELNAVHVVLTNFPHAVPEVKSYPDMLSYNAGQLFNAIKLYKLQKETMLELQKVQTKTKTYQALALILAFLCIIEGIVIYKRRS